MNRTLLCLFFFCCFLLSIFSVQSQPVRNTRYMPPKGVLSLTGGIGVAYYMGDLRDQLTRHLGLGPSVSLGALYRLTEHVSARGEIRFYQISGDQKYSTNFQNNLSFRARNPDLTVGLQADMFAYNRHSPFNPYLFGGVGVTYMTPTAVYQGKRGSLAPLQTEGVKYNRLPLVFTAGAGFSVEVAERWTVGMELCNNFVNSDYLDDVSTVYPDPASLKSDIARNLSDRSVEGGFRPNEPGWHRGNPNKKDMYLFFQLRANYVIGTRKEAHERKAVRCPN